MVKRNGRRRERAIDHGIAGRDEVSHRQKANGSQDFFRPSKTIRIVLAAFLAGLLILGIFVLIATIVLPS